MARSYLRKRKRKSDAEKKSDDVSDEEEYEVEEIQDSREVHGGDREYLVKWKGHVERTWQCLNDGECDELKRAYHASLAASEDGEEYKDDEEVEDDQEYEVEELRGKRGKGKATEYFVKWKDHEECTWEPQKNIVCPELIAAYNSRQKKKQQQQVPPAMSIDQVSESPAQVTQPLLPVEVSDVQCCRVCNQADEGVTRKCDRCKAPLHHFCSHDVAALVNKSDFGDRCFCSVSCFRPPIDDDNDNAIAEVQESRREVESLEDRKFKGARTQYLVKWKDDDKMTWEPIANLDHIQDLIAMFEFRADHIETEKGAKPKNVKTVDGSCLLCGLAEDLDDRCDVCKKKVHKLCSDKIAKDVGLDDFKLECFCSVPCYDSFILTQRVAFVPNEEKDWGWIKSDGKDKDGKPKKPKPKYPEVGDSFLVGRICRKCPRKKGSNAPSRYEVRWLETRFNSREEKLPSNVIARGRENYKNLDMDDESEEDDAEEDEEDGHQNDDEVDSKTLEKRRRRYRDDMGEPVSLKEVEAVRNMNFDFGREMKAPRDLFTHSDGSTETKVKAKYKEMFKYSASTAFFAYLPVSFWSEVVEATNAYQRDKRASFGGYGTQLPFTIDDMMIFIGILFYMRLFKKGEYRNYWGSQKENEVLGYGSNATFSHLMSIKRFKALRACFCINHGVTLDELARDPVGRIRGLVNILKKTGSRYVDVGRNIAIDESTIASRTRFAKRLICFNPSKPGGKFHFKIYMACCATSWIALNYVLYTKDSMIQYRLGGVIPTAEIDAFEADTQYCSKTRQDVLEVLRPFYGSKRIISTDNYYTSILLLEGMMLKGLYGRGTIRGQSAHFPQHVMLKKEDNCERGDMRIAIREDRKVLAGAWCDGALVHVVSNADSSAVTEVPRRVKGARKMFPAPECIKEYNKNMQGVDRLDQMRARFSIADGHSFRKWHKVLAMAFIDIARCNAYLTRQMALGASLERSMKKTKKRDPHFDFLFELTRELLNGDWKLLAPDESFLSDDDARSSSASLFSPGGTGNATKQVTKKKENDCHFIDSIKVPKLAALSWKARTCRVCSFERVKNPSYDTRYCKEHDVCLCTKGEKAKRGNRGPLPKQDYFCPNDEYTCWEKFHKFYLPKGIMNVKGHVVRSSALYKMKKAADKEIERVAKEGSQVAEGNQELEMDNEETARVRNPSFVSMLLSTEIPQMEREEKSEEGESRLAKRSLALT